MENKLFITGEQKSVVNADDLIIHGIIGSTGIIDRQGESVNPQGWQLDNYMKNPVVLYAHDYSSLPIGKAIKVEIKNNQLVFDIQFANTEMGRAVFQLYKDKILNAFSVGFAVKRYGIAGTDPYTIMEQELLELSAVPVPANPQALAKDIQSKIFSLKALAEKSMQRLTLKEGRVLSVDNQQKLEQACELIMDVLGQTQADSSEAKKALVIMQKQELEELITSTVSKTLEGSKIIEEKIVKEVVHVDGTPLSQSAYQLLLHIHQGLEKQVKKTVTIHDLTKSLLNVKNSGEGGVS